MTAKGTNITVILLIGIIVISLALAVGAFYFFQQEHTKNIVLQGELDEVKTRLKVSETNLDEFKKKTADLDAQLSLAKVNVDKLSSDLQEEKAAKLQAQSQLDRLKIDLERQLGLKSDLEKKFNQTQEEAKNAQNELRIMEARKVELESKLEEIKAKQEEESEGIELGKVVVGPESAVTAPMASSTASLAMLDKTKKKTREAVTEGKVLVVNKNYNFVVISLGSKDGVNIGNVFSVFHNDKYLGDIKVEKVHDSMAAAGFANVDIKDKVSEGDRVAQKTK